MDQTTQKRAAATIPCRWFAQGNCMRGDSCWYKHEAASASTPSDSKESAEPQTAPACGICMDEKPDTYALLSACSHAFCLTCVKSWRAQRGELQDSEVVKQCPVCRQRSFFFVPSPRFAEKGPEKDRIINSYKSRMAAIPCRNFQRSLEQPSVTPWCRFGDECFYEHSITPGGERVKVSRTDPNPRPRRRNPPRDLVETLNEIFPRAGAREPQSGSGYQAFRQANGLSTVIYDGEVYEDQLPDSDDEFVPGMEGFGEAPGGIGRGGGGGGRDANVDDLVLERLMALLSAI